jgi:hypothetical protein
MKDLLTRYKKLFADTFSRLSRNQQRFVIDSLPIIFLIGTACLMEVVLYSFIPRLLRVVALPTALLIGWWIGQRSSGVVDLEADDLFDKFWKMLPLYLGCIAVLVVLTMIRCW